MAEEFVWLEDDVRRAQAIQENVLAFPEAPAGVTDVIRFETELIFSVTRTQLFGSDDLEQVRVIQGEYGLQPLSAFLGEEAPGASPKPTFPDWVEGSQVGERFFTYLDLAMDLLEKPGQGEEGYGRRWHASASVPAIPSAWRRNQKNRWKR